MAAMARPAPPHATTSDAASSIAGAVAAGDRRAVARLITLLENEDPAAAQALQALHARTGQAHVIGVTGAPGTGKSTLVDKLIESYILGNLEF